MRAVAILLVLASATAHARPAFPLWRADHACTATRATSDAFLDIDLKARKLVRIERATGKRLADVKLPKLTVAQPSSLAALHVFDDLIAVRADRAILGIDLAGKQRWTHAFANHPLAAALDGDLVALSSEKPVRVERLNSATGAARWQTELPALAMVHRVVASEGRVFVVQELPTERTMIGVDAATGKVLWTRVDKPTALHPGTFAAVRGDLIGSVDLALWIVAGATGVATVLPLHADAISELQAAGDRLFVVRELSARPRRREVVAIDVPARTERWKVGLSDRIEVIGATATEVLVLDGPDLLLALDAATGKSRWSYGLGANVTRVTRTGGVPLMTQCVGKALVALDPSGPPLPERTVVVEGTIACAGCTEKAPRAIRIGEARGTTDAKGAFSLTVKGRGTYRLSVDVDGDWRRASAVVLGDQPKQVLGSIAVTRPEEGH